MTTEDAFSGKYENNQAGAVNNDCLNPIFESNNIDNVVGVGNCSGTILQQDESGQLQDILHVYRNICRLYCT
jgi:hypothetical protein